jgi:hypothetical protein
MERESVVEAMCHAAQQPGNVRNIVQLVGQRWCDGMVFQLHANIRNKNCGRAKDFNHGWTPINTDSIQPRKNAK